MKAGVGCSNDSNPYLSGKEVAESAIAHGCIGAPALVIAFCSGRTDHEAYFNGLQSVVGKEVPVIGGSSIGIITNDRLSYEGFPAGAAILESETLKLTWASVGHLHENEELAGKKLAKKLNGSSDNHLLLMFYDSIKMEPTAKTPPVMNASPPLIKGIEEGLKSSPPIIGAGLVGDYEFGATQQFCGSYVGNQCVVGTLFGGDVTPYFSIMHGCAPKDGIYHTITRIDGSILYEIDGRPIVDMIDDQYGNKDWRKQTPVRRLTIGVNYGDKYSEFKEGNFVNRLIAGVLPLGDGIVLFEPDLEEGTEILFMLRNSRMMIESAKRNALKLFEKIRTNGERPVFGLYIDCAGRTASMSETLTEEASEVQKVSNQYNTPLLGFYSGVEVAPFLGTSRGLDWTGILLVLAER